MNRESESFLPQIIGHRAARGFLAAATGNDRLPTGLLFHGPRGVGKAAVARAFVRALICRRRIGCGDCSPCRLHAAGSHGDAQWIEVEDGKTRISIDRVRELREWFSLSPVVGDRRIAVIDDAHRLTEEGQNALLKLLEEPPRHGLLILVTGDRSSLLETVLSRVQSVHFGPLSDVEIKDILVRSGHSTASVAADAAVRLSRGSIGAAMALLGDDSTVRLVESARGFFDRNTGPFGFAEAAVGGAARGRDLKSEASRLLEFALDAARRAQVEALTDVPSRWPHGLPPGLEVEDRVQLVEVFLDALARVDAQSPPRLVVEQTAIRVRRILGKAGRRSVPADV